MPTEVGEYTLRAQVAQTQNYKESVCETTFKITQRTAVLVWSNTTFGYDGQEHVPTAQLSNLVEGDSCQVFVNGARITPGVYTANAVALSNNNYALPDETSTTFEITKVNYSLAVNIANWAYSDEPSTPEITGVPAEAQTTIEYKPATAQDSQYSEEVPTEAGSYTVRAHVHASISYDEAYATHNFNIAQREVELIWGSTELTYTGYEIAPELTLGNVVEGDDVEAYSSGAAISVGAHKMRVLALDGNSSTNYALPRVTYKDYTIVKAELEDISLSIDNWVYGNTPSDPLLAGETYGARVSYSYKVKDGQDTSYVSRAPSRPGDYTVRAVIAETSTRKTKTLTADFSITPREVSVAWQDTSFVYDGSPHAPQCVITNLIGSDDVRVSVAGAQS